MNERKLRARSFNQGSYCRGLDPFFESRTTTEIKNFQEQEAKILRHYGVSNNNGVACAKSSEEILEVIKYCKRYPRALFNTVADKFSNLHWVWRDNDKKNKNKGTR